MILDRTLKIRPEDLPKIQAPVDQNSLVYQIAQKWLKQQEEKQ